MIPIYLIVMAVTTKGLAYTPGIDSHRMPTIASNVSRDPRIIENVHTEVVSFPNQQTQVPLKRLPCSAPIAGTLALSDTCYSMEVGTYIAYKTPFQGCDTESVFEVEGY